MAKQEVKTSIEGLDVGMYVTRLDRPWLETPFPLEGVRIESAKDIEMLGNYASFVFVDIEKGPSPDHIFWVTGGASELKLENEELPPIEPFKNKQENEYTKLRKCFYEIKTSFEQEFSHAQEAHKKIQETLEKVMDDLRKGKSLNIDVVRQGVEATVNSILRNPSAFALLLQLEKTDEYAYSHSLSTSVWCAQFGRHLGLERTQIDNLALGGMLLDIGKVKLPESLLLKKDAWSPEECLLAQTHVNESVKILAKSKNVPMEVLRMVATHHERADGSGYPEKITNDSIPLYGRIAGIVDSYDAMTSIKPHSNVVYTPHEAINELYSYRNVIFQTELVEQFIQTVGLYPTGALVELNTGEVGVVIEVNDLKRLYPTVMLVLGNDKKPLKEFITLDLTKHENGNLKVEKALPHAAFGIKMEQLFL